MRIAVIDDDKAFLDLMGWLLRERGADVVAFEQEEGTFPILVRELPDLIILDARLETPQSGWHILDLLERDPRTFQIPVILCTAAADDVASRESWLRERGIPVLLKPFEIDDLSALVDHLLNRDMPIRERSAGA